MIKLYVYKPDEFKLDNDKRIVNPILYGTGFEDKYYTKIDKCRFYGSNYNWKNEFRLWDKYEYNQEIFKFVDNPDNAEFILFPYTLDELYQEAIEKQDPNLIKYFLKSLPLFQERERDHVFISFVGKDMKLDTSAIILKTGINQGDKDINSYAWPYPIEDYKELIHYSNSKIKYGVNFIGCDMSHEVRKIANESITQLEKLSSYIETYDNFFTTNYKMDAEVIAVKRHLYLDAIINSYTTLCPRGFGLTSIRFFETMMLGRIPVLIADDAELPFNNYINYKQFCIMIKEKDAKHTADILMDFFNRTPADVLLEMGMLARRYWEDYFKCQNWQYSVFTLLQDAKRKETVPIYLIGNSNIQNFRRSLC